MKRSGKIIRRSGSHDNHIIDTIDITDVKKDIRISNIKIPAEAHPIPNIKTSLPKIIMQTWKDNRVPLRWHSSVESVKRFMPDWKHVLMTDDDNREFVKKHFPEFLLYYDRFEYPIQRADAIRYCWLAIHGGIYMDLDMEILKPLDDLFTGHHYLTSGITNQAHHELYLVSSGNIGSVITNSFMASTAGHPLWFKVIEAMKKPLPWWYLGKHWIVMNSTGPVMLNSVVKRSKYIYAALPNRSIMPCSVCDSICQVQDAYIKPLEGSSWVSFDSIIYNFLLCNWKKIVLTIVVLIVVVLLYLGMKRLNIL